MRITLAAPYDGHDPDETIDVDDTVGRVLVADGYARIPDGNGSTSSRRPSPRSSTVREVLAAVGTDPTLARTALDAEQARGDKARSSLIDRLTELVTDNEGDTDGR